MPTLPSLILIMLLLLPACACSKLDMRRPYGEGRLPMRHLDPVERRLEIADSASAHLLLGEIGRIGPAGAEAKVWRMAYRPFEPDLKRILLIAGVRGDEAAGPEAVLQLVETLSGPPDAATRYDMDIIPIVNPWGWANDLPFSRSGVDIDADFSSFDAPEARVVRRFFREKRYDLTIDLREDAEARGFSIWQYGLGDRSASERVTQSIRAAGYPVEPDSGRVLLKPRNGVVDAPLWGLTVMQLTRRLSLAGYLRQNVSHLVFTAQAPASLPLADRVAMLRLAINEIISEYGKKR